MRSIAPDETVRELALDLLCRVAGYEDPELPRGPANRSAEAELVPGKEYRTVGLSYEEVLAHIVGRFPHAKTNIACLRWYCSQVRAADVPGFKSWRLPQVRPRKRPERRR